MTSTTLGAARTAYYDANGFGADGGDALAWVPIKLWKLTFKIPNTEGRRRAVKIHDLHHVVTGYQTTWTGEAEIAAWELSTGCLSSAAATVLNLGGLAVGLVIAPRAIVRAWARGRQSKNLYTEPRLDARRGGSIEPGVDHLLGRELGEVRTELALDRPPPRPRVRDAVATVALALPPLAVVTALALAPLVGLALLASAVL